MDSLQPGDPLKIGSYRLVGRLGAGGMGQVFLGTSPGGRKVAVKLIHPDHANAAQFRERFAREIEAARRVGGFHTALVVDADPDADPPWMVTAYIQGPSLQDAVAGSGPLGTTEVRALGAGLAEGLAAIHASGLVHRDLKPSNVILADDGPRIIDFGIARAVEASTMTTAGVVVGTFAYMSPEQVRGDPAGPASDVFALACTLAFAATGRPPFGSESIPTVVYRITSEPPDLTGVPEEGHLRQVIAACLAKTPVDRPSLVGILAGLTEPGPDGDGTAAGASATVDAVSQPITGAGRGPGTEDAMPPAIQPQVSQQGAPTRTDGRLRRDDAAELYRLSESEAASPAPPGRARLARRGKTWKVWAVAAVVIVLAAAVPLIYGALAAAPGGAAAPFGLAGVYSASRYGFNYPYAIAADANHVWVANDSGNSVTELDAGNGSWVQTLSGGSYRFKNSGGIIDDGTHVWVTNTDTNSVTELAASNGSWVRTLSGGNYGIDQPEGLMDDGTHLWITNSGGNSVTEVNASNGALVRTLSGGDYRFNEPWEIAFDGTHIWITNSGGNSVTEVNASNGALVRTLSGGDYRFSSPFGIAFDDKDIWITNYNGASVTEVNGSSGSLVRTLSGGNYRLKEPGGIAVDGTNIWITDVERNSVTELNAGNGSLERTLSGGNYEFDGPICITIVGTHAWVGNTSSSNGEGSVTELTRG
jgi:hypothetical protein